LKNAKQPRSNSHKRCGAAHLERPALPLFAFQNEVYQALSLLHLGLAHHLQ
jgi:hypothetical protein